MSNWKLGMLVAVWAVGCGGGSSGSQQQPDASSGPDAAAMGTAIGPAGGTVTGPNGVKLVIPAGALTSTVTITVEATTLGTYPSIYTQIGSNWKFGPNGTTFSTPATLTLPFDPGLVPVGTVNYRTVMFDDTGANASTLSASATVDSVNHTLTDQVMHFTIYGPSAQGAN